MKDLFLLSIFAICSNIAFTQFTQVQTLKEADKLDFSLSFYPSTLRMINIDQDTAFNKMIKGIRKLSFHQLNMDSIDRQAFFSLKERILVEENYEDYITISNGRGTDQSFDVMGNEKGDQWIAMGLIEGQGYLIALRGTINWLQAPALYQSLLEKKDDSNSGFSILLNYFSANQNRSARRREWARKREEAEKATTAAKDSTVVEER